MHQLVLARIATLLAEDASAEERVRRIIEFVESEAVPLLAAGGLATSGSEQRGFEPPSQSTGSRPSSRLRLVGETIASSPGDLELEVRSRLTAPGAFAPSALTKLMLDIQTSIASFERRGAVSVERCADSILHVTGAIDPSLVVGSLHRLIPHVVRVTDSYEGLLLTASMIAVQLSRAGDLQSALELNEWIGDEAESIELDDAARRSVLQRIAGNSAAAIGRWGQDTGRRGRSDPRVHLYRSLAAVNTVPPTGSAPHQIVRALALPVESIGVESDAGVAALVAVVAEYGQSPESNLSEGLQVAALEALAAIFVSANLRPENGPGLFFNAGVTSLTTPRLDGEDEQDRRVLRIFLNAIGLLWSLRLAGDLEELRVVRSYRETASAAWDRYDGMDCAVNLAGALAETVRQNEDPTVSAIARKLLGYLGELLGTDNTQRLRIQGSFDVARVSPTERPFVPVDLLSSLSELSQAYQGFWSAKPSDRYADGPRMFFDPEGGGWLSLIDVWIGTFLRWSFHGSIWDWLAELAHAIERGDQGSVSARLRDQIRSLPESAEIDGRLRAEWLNDDSGGTAPPLSECLEPTIEVLAPYLEEELSAAR